MDARISNLEDMTEAELRELINTAQETLDRMIARRAKQTLKEARRLSAEVGFEVSFTKAAQPEGRAKGRRGKAVQKYRNPENPAETWSGRGRPPRWVQTALAGGRTMPDLQITPTD
jgi:DNA-binding protein H-NS